MVMWCPYDERRLEAVSLELVLFCEHFLLYFSRQEPVVAVQWFDEGGKIAHVIYNPDMAALDMMWARSVASVAVAMMLVYILDSLSQ